MLRALRNFALLTSLLSIQLSLFGGGAGCDLRMVMPNGAVAMAEMGMSMAMDEPTPHSSSCDAPPVSNVCSAMTVCVFAAMTVSGTNVPIEVAPSALKVVLATLAPDTLGVAPDHPPPRA